VGQSGCGKTYRLLQLLKKVKRGIHFDTPNNIGHGERQNPMPGWFVISGYAQFVEFFRVNSKKNFRVVYKPGRDAAKEFHAICMLVFAMGNVVFSVDEMWEFVNPNWMPTPLNRIVFCGRAPGVTLLWIAQQPQKVSTDLRSQTSSVYAFRIQQGSALKAIEADLLPSAAVRELPRLKDRHYIYRDEQENWKVVNG
jgi:hypothetical protein